jgi:hypothetical protein
MASDIWMESAGEVAQKALEEAERRLMEKFGTAERDQIVTVASIVAQAYNAFLTRRSLANIASEVHDCW